MPSLEIVDEKGTEIYRDFAQFDNPPNPTIDDFRTKLFTDAYDKTWPAGEPIYYIPKWFDIVSIKITNIASGKEVPFEETDRVGQYPFDEYIFRVDIKRKPRAAPKAKNTGNKSKKGNKGNKGNKTGGRRRKTRVGSRQ